MNVFKSLKFALRGIIYTIRNERNMRIHTVIGFYVMFLSIICDMNFIEYIILITIISLVIIGEMFNSSIEHLIDLCAKEYNSTAKAAKDISAGGVLVLAFGAFISGILMFKDKNIFIRLINVFSCNLYLLIFFIISIILSYLYISIGPSEIKNKIKNFFYKILKNKKTEYKNEPKN